MKITITGSRGFIGSYLKDRLELEGHEIVEWDSRIDKHIKDFVVGESEYVIHLAARADVRASIEDPQFYWENNVINTTNIQKKCYIQNIPLLYASSSCIHNWWLSPYGISKKVNEETSFSNQVGLRFTTVYGEGARDTMLISRLVSGNIKYLTNHVRDFIHVNDVVDAITLLISKDIKTLKPAYDIGTGVGNVVSDLGKHFGYENLPVSDGDACEAKNNTADISEMKSLGWNPTIEIKKYLSEKALLKHKNIV
jgi:UDP-glucuronate 4-epimerase